jgi:4-hydroxybenzoate polyprenyltransferase
MFFLLGIFITFFVTLAGFVVSQRFVEGRLRYVDAVQRPYAPIVAGAVAALVAWPIVAILPLVGVGTAILFGVSVFAGVASGAREIRRRIGA